MQIYYDNRSFDTFSIKCKECIKFLPSQQIEPIINQNVATHPMEIIGLDLCQSDGMSFLVLIDQFSGFPMVQKLPPLSSLAVIHAIAWYFNLLGNPRVMMQDQGKQLTSQEFKDFANKRGIKLIYSVHTTQPPTALQNQLSRTSKSYFSNAAATGESSMITFNTGVTHQTSVATAQETSSLPVG